MFTAVDGADTEHLVGLRGVRRVGALSALWGWIINMAELPVLSGVTMLALHERQCI